MACTRLESKKKGEAQGLCSLDDRYTVPSLVISFTMNKFSILFALFAIVACVAAMSQPSMNLKAGVLECEGNYLFSFVSLLFFCFLPLHVACHVIVNAIDQWLAENKTEVYLEGKLETVCALIKSAETVVRSPFLSLLPYSSLPFIPVYIPVWFLFILIK